MKITGLETYCAAIPFIAPIFSAYGVSYPARLRTFIRVHTDEGLIGVGEAGVSASHIVKHGEQARIFEEVVGPQIIGENPFDYLAIMKKLRYIPESVAVELACWDIMGKKVGLPVYRLLGNSGYRESVPMAAYFFFRGPDRDGKHAVDLDNCVDHVKWLIAEYGFRTVKMKLGVYEPLVEAEAVERVRAAIGPHIKMRIDPNGCWSLPTARRMLKRLEPCDLEFVEEPIKYVPSRRAITTQEGVPSLDTAGLAALRRTSATPIAADGVYRIDLLWQAARDQAADIALGDIQGCWGIRGHVRFLHRRGGAESSPAPYTAARKSASSRRPSSTSSPRGPKLPSPAMRSTMSTSTMCWSAASCSTARARCWCHRDPAWASS